MTGRLWLEVGLVKNRSTLFGDWEVPVADLRLVGEATNEEGPFLDDWMLVFATGPEGWREASMYAPGHDKFLCELGQMLGGPLFPALAGSTTFASRVLWPQQLYGQPVFTYNARRAASVAGRLLEGLLGPTSCTRSFTEDVRHHLGRPLSG
jgi:hypothetical protein